MNWQKLYKQEAELVPLTSWPWLFSACNLPFDSIEEGMGNIGIYFKGAYGITYFNEKALYSVASAFYDGFNEGDALERLHEKFRDHAHALMAIYTNHDRESVLKYDADSMSEFVACVIDVYRSFWRYSFFIDSYDVGFDQEKIDFLSSKYALTPEETASLLLPDEHNYLNERRMAFLEMAREVAFQPGLTTRECARAALTECREAWEEHMKEYGYYKSNYAHVRRITQEDIIDELVHYLGNVMESSEEYERLQSYCTTQRRKVVDILARRSMNANPFNFFQKLTHWRDQRKKINLMGIHVLEWIAEWLERRTSVDCEYLKYLTYEELFDAIEGSLREDELRRRRDEGVFVQIEGDDYTLHVGAEGAAMCQMYEKMCGEKESGLKEVKGRVASHGCVKGRATVVLRRQEYGKFKSGDILVAAMAKPEYMPLIEQASAIITDEGGVTCHAALIAREFRIPCVVGTRNATKYINDGNIVEICEDGRIMIDAS